MAAEENKVKFLQSIKGKLALAFGLMVVVIMMCGAVGWFSVNKLGGLLENMAGGVYSTASSALKADGWNNKSDKIIERILSGLDDTEEKKNLEKAIAVSDEAMKATFAANMLPADVAEQLKKANDINQKDTDNVLACDDEFTKSYNAFTETTKDMMEALDILEERGDASFDEYSSAPDKPVTWNGGLELTWNGADGTMNILIATYKQNYLLEGILHGQDKASALKAIEESQKFIDSSIIELNTSPLAKTKIETGANAGKPAGEVLPGLIKQHSDLLADLLKKDGERNALRDKYRASGEDLVNAYGAAVASADKMATDTRDAIPVIQRDVYIALATALLIGLILAIGAALVSSRIILTPIGNVVARLQDIAQGEGDLTRRLKMDRGDEIGKLAFWFDTFVERIHLTVKSVADHTQTLSAASVQTASTSNNMSTNALSMTNQSTCAAAATEQASSSIRNVAAAIEEISANSNTVASEADHVSKSLGNVGSAVEEVSGNMNTTAAAVEEMSTSLNTIASSVEEMSASLKGVSTNTSEAAQLAGTAAEKADATAAKVNRLGASAKEIDKVVDLITGIAEQTNLLALNATIEAASAGEAGKGFAVVANEVKELAKQTGRATQEIRQQVEEMQTNTGQAVTAISEIVTVIGKVNETFAIIASAVHEQSLTINEIVRNVSDAAKGGEEVSVNVQAAARSAGLVAQNVQQAISSVNAIAQSVNELALGANEIARNAAEASQGMNEVSKNVQEVNVAAQTTKGGAEELTTAAQGLSGLAGQLQQLVGVFAV